MEDVELEHWFNDRTRKMEIIIVYTRTYGSAEQGTKSAFREYGRRTNRKDHLLSGCRTMITGDDNDELIERGDYSRSNTGKTHVYYRKSYIPGLAGLE